MLNLSVRVTDQLATKIVNQEAVKVGNGMRKEVGYREAPHGKQYDKKDH